MTPKEAQDQAREIVDANPSENTLSVPRGVLAELAYVSLPPDENHYLIFESEAPGLIYVGDGITVRLDGDRDPHLDDRSEAIMGALLDLAQRRLMRARIEREQDMHPPQTVEGAT